MKILVTGATGAQGGAVVKILLKHSHHVVAMTRNLESEAAKELISLGATVVEGDMGNVKSIEAALQGVDGVFSMQALSAMDSTLERTHGFNLIQAAKKLNIVHFVHTSVSGTGFHKTMPGWEEGRWIRIIAIINGTLRNGCEQLIFPYALFLKPAFLWKNFILPKAPVLVSKIY